MVVVSRRTDRDGRLAMGLLLASLVGVGSPALAGSLEGIATLKVSMPVPADALVEVQLQQLGAADAPAVLLGKARFKAGSGAPFPFRIPYVEGMVQPGHRYSVRAVISEAGRLLFSSDTVQPVFQGSSAALQLQLMPVGDAPLRGVIWLQAPAASLAVSAQAARQEVQLRLDPLSPSVSGSADCNRLEGSYRLEGDRLRFGAIDTTVLRCEPEVMADELRLLNDLQRVRGWRFVDRYFEMLDDTGTLLLKLETRPQPATEAPAGSP